MASTLNGRCTKLEPKTRGKIARISLRIFALRGLGSTCKKEDRSILRRISGHHGMFSRNGILVHWRVRHSLIAFKGCLVLDKETKIIRKLILARMKDNVASGWEFSMKYVFSFLTNWRTSVVIQHSDLNSRRDKAVCGKQCKTGSAIRHLCLNRGRMTRVGSRKYLQLIFQKSTSCCVRCQALRIMVHHLTTEGHCSNRTCRI